MHHKKEEGTKLSVYYSKRVSKNMPAHSIEGLRSTYSRIDKQQEMEIETKKRDFWLLENFEKFLGSNE